MQGWGCFIAGKHLRRNFSVLYLPSLPYSAEPVLFLIACFVLSESQVERQGFPCVFLCVTQPVRQGRDQVGLSLLGSSASTALNAAAVLQVQHCVSLPVSGHRSWPADGCASTAAQPNLLSVKNFYLYSVRIAVAMLWMCFQYFSCYKSSFFFFFNVMSYGNHTLGYHLRLLLSCPLVLWGFPY